MVTDTAPVAATLLRDVEDIAGADCDMESSSEPVVNNAALTTTGVAHVLDERLPIIDVVETQNEAGAAEYPNTARTECPTNALPTTVTDVPPVDTAFVCMTEEMVGRLMVIAPESVEHCNATVMADTDRCLVTEACLDCTEVAEVQCDRSLYVQPSATRLLVEMCA
jgi:hypothetical protein